ncbi:hypothetical protein GEMRC1_000099 [Eukaryota sp. GEM-RC1]
MHNLPTPTILCQKLDQFREFSSLTDVIITYVDQEFPVHRAIVSLHSSFLDSLPSRSRCSAVYEIPKIPTVGDSLVDSVLRTFYGKPLTINTSNISPLIILASHLNYPALSTACQSCLVSGLATDFVFKLDSSDIVHKLKESRTSDVIIKFKSTKIPAHSMLLCCWSKFFENRIIGPLAEDNDDDYDFTEKFGFSDELFEKFFAVFYCQNIDLNIRNFFEFFHLAVYFQVEFLQNICFGFLSNYSLSIDDVINLIKKSGDLNDFYFVNEFKYILSKVTITTDSTPIRLPLSFIVNLLELEVFNNLYLLKCVVVSYDLESSAHEELISILRYFSNGVPLDQIFEILVDLFDNSECTHTLYDWTLEILNSDKSTKLPCKWFFFLIKTADLLEDTTTMTILSSLFPKFLQSTPIESLPELVCSPKTFCQLSSNVLSSHVLWFTSNLVSAYNNSNWNVDEFENCFYSLDFSSTPINLLVQVLAPLKSEKELRRFLLEFNSVVIVPKLIQISEEQQIEILNLKRTISDSSRSPAFKVKKLDESFESDMSTALTQPRRELPHVKWKRFNSLKLGKHNELKIRRHGKRVEVVRSGNKYRNILGEYPLLPGNVYTWKLRYQGTTNSLAVGVIHESKFSVDGSSFENAHCFFSHNPVCGGLLGNTDQWNPGEALEINANLNDQILSIKSVSNSSINLTGTLPRFSSGNYYLYAFLYWADHVLEIGE